MPVPNKILIVDDSQAEGRLIQALLEEAGYWAVALTDPKRIEEVLEVERPSLILLDIVMPERNGFQACRELKAQPSYAHIPIVMVTSKNTESDQYWGLQQGAEGYVFKPFTRERLLAEINKVLGKKQAISTGATAQR
ncbi:MAG: response regulator [Candidatus Korobacteraceae bacterium]